MSAAYYPNKWFSPYEQPYLTRVDPVVNFNWNGTVDIIPGIAKEYVSIEWTGYFMPRQTGAYSFKVEADDGVRLLVNGELIVDRMVDAPANEVHRVEGAPSVQLEAS